MGDLAAGGFGRGLDTDQAPHTRRAIQGSSTRAGGDVMASTAADATEPDMQPTAKPDSPSLQRHHKIFLLIACTCALISTCGLAASAFVRSPAQVAADSQPPPASILTAPVEYRVLTNTLVTRGTVAASSQFAVTPQSSTQGASIQVITGVRAAVGDHVQPGQVLVEISGRPLFALPGAVPAYRDLKPDDDGADVAQLQNALASMGDYDGGDPAGHFGPATKQAITKLYAAVRYDVPTTGGHDDEGDLQALRGAQSAVDAAQRAVDDMKRQIAAQPTPPTNTGAEPPALQLKYLQQALTAAKAAQADLIAKTGPMLPLAEAVFLPSFPAQIVQLDAKVGDLVKAPLITLSSGQLAVTAHLNPDQGGVVKVGMKVDVASEVLGLDVSGTVTAVGAAGTAADASSGSTDGSARSGSLTVPVTITPASELPIAWAGQDVRVTITSAATPKPVFVVPLSAVSAGASGQTSVSELQADGNVVQIPVAAGISGDGFVEITPTEGGIKPGDRVVIGS